MVDFGNFLLGLTAFVGTLAAPILMARWFWTRAAGSLGRPLSILLFAPCLVAVEWGLIRLLFYAAHDDGEGPPGLGVLLVPSFAVFAVTLAVFYGTAGMTAVRWLAKAPR